MVQLYRKALPQATIVIKNRALHRAVEAWEQQQQQQEQQERQRQGRKDTEEQTGHVGNGQNEVAAQGSLEQQAGTAASGQKAATALPADQQHEHMGAEASSDSEGDDGNSCSGSGSSQRGGDDNVPAADQQLLALLLPQCEVRTPNHQRQGLLTRPWYEVNPCQPRGLSRLHGAQQL